MAVPWNLENAAHLLRRAAFGGTPAQIQAFHDAHSSVTDAVAELLSFTPSKKKPPGPRNVDDFGRLKMQRWWLKLMINSATPAEACREKLVLYWHTHLASGANKQPTLKYMSFQNRLFRMNARGNFRDLVRAFNRDPANLYYLDGITNVASTDGVHVGANENWGRELMELFTLGRFQLASDGTADPTKTNYTENDVHNMARACTGWTSIKKDTGIWHQEDWDGGQYDDDGDGNPDPMRIFGFTSNNFRIDDGVAGTSDDVLKLIFDRTDSQGNNQVGMFLSRKLWTFFAYPPPAAGLKTLLAGFANAFVASGFDITALLTAMWTADEFYSDTAKSRTVKNPTDLVVQSLRAVGVKSDGKTVGNADREMGDQCRLMGMNLFEPPNVAGWPGGLAWINSGTLLMRMSYARDLADADFGKNQLRLTSIAGLPLGDASADPAAVVDAVIAQFGLDQGPAPISAAQRNTLLDYLTDGGTNTSLDLSDAFTDDAKVKVRGLAALVLQSAEHQVY